MVDVLHCQVFLVFFAGSALFSDKFSMFIFHQDSFVPNSVRTPPHKTKYCVIAVLLCSNRFLIPASLPAMCRAHLESASQLFSEKKLDFFVKITKRCTKWDRDSMVGLLWEIAKKHPQVSNIICDFHVTYLKLRFIMNVML